MDSLFKEGIAAVRQSALQQLPTTAPHFYRASPTIDPTMELFELAQTQDPEPLGLDVPSLDDLLGL